MSSTGAVERASYLACIEAAREATVSLSDASDNLSLSEATRLDVEFAVQALAGAMVYLCEASGRVVSEHQRRMFLRR